MRRLILMWSSLRLYLRHGLLLQILLQRLSGGLPLPEQVRWEGARSPVEALVALRSWGLRLLRAAPASSELLVVGEGALAEELVAELHRRDAAAVLVSRQHCIERADSMGQCAGVLCCYLDAAEQTAVADVVSKHPGLREVPFEFVSGLSPAQARFAKTDEYADTWFVSPVLLSTPSPYEIYENSLKRFEQKCGLRDYLDLYQMLRYLHDNQVPGDVAEFGSYRGHSGYLIARTLEALGSDKRLFMFDMFEEFPAEAVGVDHFWNESHYVNFAEVQAKFRGLERVSLVRGDFTQTFEQSGIDELALAYIDCDSYRATAHMIERLWPQTLVTGGALVCEDYGHPALLGNRLAVHQQLDERPRTFRFFSQFSGLYIAVKL